ncbi:2-phosphosulfolactate phosphatase [Streptomyces sp. NPDC012389]|uniref:2-phosphosulfolactate phosphatase n=1 Tax=Streptomyces sp. NPDC012389 TaxID=3364830 RepID=UPI0036EA1045
MNTRFLSVPELSEVPSVAVVVDVMRACTVAAWAFARGAEKIVLAGSPDEALALRPATRIGEASPVLCAGGLGGLPRGPASPHVDR